MLATAEATARYAARHPECAPGHWRGLRGLTVGSIGLGSYLGREEDAADATYAHAVRRAIALGCNVLDTAINYRHQRSERAIGRALQEAFDIGQAHRAEVVVCTKGGYLPFDGRVPDDPDHYLYQEYVAPGILRPGDLVDGCHALTPAYLDNQLRRSLRNLLLPAVDVYYVHNPEHALAELSPQDLEERLRGAFALLERRCTEGKVGCYGVATWAGLRTPPEEEGHLSLERLVAIAGEAAASEGLEGSRFAAVQAPLNLGMTEALTAPTQVVGGRRMPLVRAAGELGVHVVGSASLLQGRLARGLPAFVEGVLGLGSDAHRALQFARSAPGLTTALVGMGRPEHAEENLALARSEPAGADEVRMLFEAAARAG